MPSVSTNCRSGLRPRSLMPNPLFPTSDIWLHAQRSSFSLHPSSLLSTQLIRDHLHTRGEFEIVVTDVTSTHPSLSALTRSGFYAQPRNPRTSSFPTRFIQAVCPNSLS